MHRPQNKQENVKLDVLSRSVLPSQAWVGRRRPRGLRPSRSARLQLALAAGGGLRVGSPGQGSGPGRKASGAGVGRGGPERSRLTRSRAVDVALGTTAAHLKDPGAQQLGVGAVGRGVAVCGAHPAEEQEGDDKPPTPGTHAGGAGEAEEGAAPGGQQRRQQQQRGSSQRAP